MSVLTQYILVGIIVAGAFAVSIWKLMPSRRRLALLVALDAWAARHPSLARWRTRVLQPRIARATSAGCSGCSVAPTRPHRPR